MAVTETPKEAARRLAKSQIDKGYLPEALHEYRSADGAVLYWRIRAKHPSGDKWIRPMRPTQEGYKLGEPDFPNGKPLYRLPDIAQSDGPVYVVEGENCVDALRGIGVCATTSGAADSGSKADWTPLSGRDVRIWPDNDRAGAAYAVKVVNAIRKAGAGSIEVVDVEKLDLAEKGDAVDWLAANPGATADNVANLKRFTPPPAAEPKPVTGDRVVKLSRMADVRPEPIKWLWEGRIPLGKLVVFAGDPGLGKSLLTIAIAAHVSKGSRWPVDHSVCPIGDVVLLSAEDDPADTIRPRLDAAGADVSRVYVLESVSEVARDGNLSERSVSLRRDLDLLESTLETLPDCKLVVIDPVAAFMESADSYKDAEVRGFLSPITKLAARCNVAVIAVMHLNKSRSNNPLSNVNGSVGYVAASRAAFVVTKDKEDESRRLVLPLKNNLGPDSSGVAYQIVVAKNGAPTIGWEPDPVNLTARDVLGVDSDDDEQSAREQAADWLKEVLQDGRMKVSDLRAQATAAGYSWSTVQRAKMTLGIKPEKGGFQGQWYWEYPPKAINEPKDTQVNNRGAFGDRDHLWGEGSESEHFDPEPEDGREKVIF